MPCHPRPRLAVWKFASCDGCQLSLLDCEQDLLALADAVCIAQFAEATSTMLDGPYDISLVEGSITTEHDLERIRKLREMSARLVTIGACASAGGIQALRNLADIDDYVGQVYATPAYVRTLATSTPISAHVAVDYELRGCPVDKTQLLEVIAALLAGGRPAVATHSVCIDCKRRGNVCVMVQGEPCLGPVTHAGCGALCPAFRRGCYGCFGPMEQPNMGSLAAQWRRLGATPKRLRRALHGLNVGSAPFLDEGLRQGLLEPPEASTHDDP
jgi:coenzyme F420-reducing hydrogenase gamma subunit